MPVRWGHPGHPDTRPSDFAAIAPFFRAIVAADAGFAGMQFNAVVETNAAAVHLWRSLGFEVMTTIPEGFEHARHGRVGLHVMYRRFA